MSRPRRPRIHVTRLDEIGGEVYESGVTPPVCDFCLDTRPRWTYPCERFAIPSIAFGDAGEGWAACDDCSALIEADDWTGLYDRASSGMPGDWTIAVPLIWQGFRDHRTGPREPWG